MCSLPWSVVTLLGVTQSKTTDSPSPRRNQMSIAPQRGAGLAHLLTPHAGICLSLGHVNAFRITANSCVKLPTVPAQSGFLDVVFCLLALSIFLTPFFMMPDSWEEGNDLSIIFRVEHSTVYYSPLACQFRTLELIVIYYKGKCLWWGMRAICIYEYREKSLKVLLILCLFNFCLADY